MIPTESSKLTKSGPASRGVVWPGAKWGRAEGETRVVLLSLNWWRPKDPRTPLGTAYLYSWIASKLPDSDGVRVGFVDHHVAEGAPVAVQDVLGADPAVLGIGVYVWNCDMVREVTASLRSLGFGGKIVLGGPEISYGGRELSEEYPFVDYFVKGDGEAAFEEVVRAHLEWREPTGEGIFSRNSKTFDGQAHLPRGEEPIQPQSLPELIPLIVKDGFTRIQFQRGCIYGCTFCAFPYPDRTFRNLDLSSLRRDLSNLRDAGVQTLAVLDPIFFVDRPRALSILDALHEELPDTRFEIQSRLEHMSETIVRRLSTMNVLLECGVQTLDPSVQKIIRRGANRHQVEAMLGLLQQLGIRFETHLIFGLPMQTTRSFLGDLDFLLGYEPERLRVFPLLNLKGTELSRDTQAKFLGKMSFSTEFPREVQSTAWMPAEEIAALKQMHAILEETTKPATAGIDAIGLYNRLCQAPSRLESAPLSTLA
jgi:radical SAM superfamily enzyme YgiQ (UPF0313 family)